MLPSKYDAYTRIRRVVPRTTVQNGCRRSQDFGQACLGRNIRSRATTHKEVASPCRVSASQRNRLHALAGPVIQPILRHPKRLLLNRRFKPTPAAFARVG